jgi:hypothetical protein
MPYRISPALYPQVQEKIQEMLEKNVICHSNSPWSSPVVLIKKKDNSLRLCLDYRKINEITRHEIHHYLKSYQESQLIWQSVHCPNSNNVISTLSKSGKLIISGVSNWCVQLFIVTVATSFQSSVSLVNSISLVCRIGVSNYSLSQLQKRHFNPQLVW